MKCAFARIVPAAGAALLLGWLLLIACTQPLNHDEHQFLAAGRLMRHGLWPWRHFPLFQMPLLPMWYALLSFGTDWLLLAGRLTAALAAWSVLLWVWRWTVRLAGSGFAGRLMATAIVFMLAVHPVLVYAAAKAWNHSAGLWLTCLATGWWLQAHRGAMGWRVPFLSGLALALAAGVRLTYAVAGLPLLVGWLWLSYIRQRGLVGWWVVGGMVGLAPVLACAAAAPERFFDQTVRYHVLVDAIYFRSLGGAMDWPQRLAFAWDVLTANYYLPFSLGAMLAGFFAFRQKKHRSVWLMAVGTALMLLWAGLQKVVVFTQYFYVPLPFLALALACGAAAFAERQRQMAVGVLVLWAAVQGWNQRAVFSAFAKWNQPERWTPVALHRQAQRIVALTGPDTVLTLSPLHVLEGGGAVFPAFAASPFAWRTAAFWPEDMRARNGIVGADQLDDFARSHTIRAILTGFEPGIEDALDRWAEARGMTPLMPDDSPAVLWLQRHLVGRRLADSLAGPLVVHGEWGPSLRDTLSATHAPLWLKASLELHVPEPKPRHPVLLVLELRRGDELLHWQARKLLPFYMKAGQWQRLWLACRIEGPLTGGELLKAYLWRPQGGADTAVRRLTLETAQIE